MVAGNFASMRDADRAFADPVLTRLYHTRTRLEARDGASDVTRERLCADMMAVLEESEKSIEREMVADILLSLIRKADTDIKRGLSERLAVLPSVPLRLILNLIGDTIDVATPVLRHSDALNDLDLLYIIQSCDAPYWRVIAAREGLGENVVEALVDTNDIGTVDALVDNATVSFTTYAADKAGELSLRHENLAHKMMARRDIPEAVRRKIYAHAGAAIRQEIRRDYGLLSQLIEENIADVVSEFGDPSKDGYVPSRAMMRAADLFMRDGKLTPLLMVRTIQRGQVASFIAQFSTYCGVPVALVMSMLQQRSREGLAIACKATGLTRNDLAHILQMTRHLPEETALTDDAVNAALHYYDRVSEHAAQRLMKRSRN